MRQRIVLLDIDCNDLELIGRKADRGHDDRTPA